MRLLGLVRHGVTEWNAQGRLQGQRNTPLSGQGKLQAAALGRALSRDGWEAIYSSDLERAAETARLLARASGFPEAALLADERLRERSFGPLEGTTLAEREARWGGAAYDAPGVESPASVASRGAAFCADILRRPERRVLAVTHGAFIKLLLAELLGERAPTVDVDNASMTLLAHDGEGWSGLAYNLKSIP